MTKKFYFQGTKSAIIHSANARLQKNCKMTKVKEDFEWVSPDQAPKYKATVSSKLFPQVPKSPLSNPDDVIQISTENFQKPEGVDWVKLTKDMDEVSGNVYVEPMSEKMIRKVKQEPLVPIGIMATVAALGTGIYHFTKGGRHKQQQKMMRLRIAAQGFTIIAALGGYMYYNDDSIPLFKPLLTDVKNVIQFVKDKMDENVVKTKAE